MTSQEQNEALCALFPNHFRMVGGNPHFVNDFFGVKDSRADFFTDRNALDALLGCLSAEQGGRMIKYLNLNAHEADIFYPDAGGAKYMQKVCDEVWLLFREPPEKIVEAILRTFNVWKFEL